MKAELNIDTQELASQITREVMRAVKPLLKDKSKNDDILFTVKTLAEYLQVSNQWVYERVSLKEIPYIKMGKFPRFRKSEIDSWLDSQKIPAMHRLSRKLRLVK